MKTGRELLYQVLFWAFCTGGLLVARRRPFGNMPNSLKKEVQNVSTHRLESASDMANALFTKTDSPLYNILQMQKYIFNIG